MEVSAGSPAEMEQEEEAAWLEGHGEKQCPRVVLTQLCLSALPPWIHALISSHIKGCFIPDKSQSSPSRCDSGLVFILDVSALHTCTLGEAGCALASKASWRRTSLAPL